MCSVAVVFDLNLADITNGESDVKEFIDTCNVYAESMGLTVRFEYYKGLTYGNLLNQLNNEQI